MIKKWLRKLKANIFKLNLLNLWNTSLGSIRLPRFSIDNIDDMRECNPRIIKIRKMIWNAHNIQIGHIDTKENRNDITNIINFTRITIVSFISNQFSTIPKTKCIVKNNTEKSNWTCKCCFLLIFWKMRTIILNLLCKTIYFVILSTKIFHSFNIFNYLHYICMVGWWIFMKLILPFLWKFRCEVIS